MAGDRVRIRLDCDSCGPVQIEPQGMKIVDVRDGAAYYVFRCPECRQIRSGYTRPEFVEPLVRSGAVRHEVPAEALEEHDGEPVGYDDLLEFHFLLEGLDGTAPDAKA